MTTPIKSFATIIKENNNCIQKNNNNDKEKSFDLHRSFDLNKSMQDCIQKLSVHWDNYKQQFIELHGEDLYEKIYPDIYSCNENNDFCDEDDELFEEMDPNYDEFDK
jgi:hypothetical protein